MSDVSIHQPLIDRITDVLAEDERIVSAWLSGSLGRGEGDAWSDVDVTCVVEEEDLSACVAEYAGKRNPIGETLILRSLYGRVVTAVTPDWQRYDLAFMTVQEFRSQDPAALRLLTPKGASPPSGGPRRSQPMQAERLAGLIEEFLRVLGLLPVAVERQEFLVGQDGVGLLRTMLVDLMVEANGKTGLRGGVKRLNAFLSEDQRRALEALPARTSDRDALIEASTAPARLFLPLAKAMAAERGVAWPQALEDATRRHLRASLGVVV